LAEVLVGTCGLPASAEKLSKLVDAVEVQESFYNLLGERRLRTISSLASYGLRLAWKAWQATTHPSTSPTWRRAKQRPPGDPEAYGHLKPTRENLKAAEETVEQAVAAGAEVVVFQTPSSMPLDERTRAWVQEFFGSLLSYFGSKVRFAWEPRGACAEDAELHKRLAELGVTVVFDVLKRGWPSAHAGFLYTRLHGLGPGETNYRYKYADEDLSRLKAIVEEGLRARGAERVYVMFNNIYMLDDAARFRSLLREAR